MIKMNELLNPVEEAVSAGLVSRYRGRVIDWCAEHVKLVHSSRSKTVDPAAQKMMNDPLDAIFDSRNKNVCLLTPTGGGKSTLVELLTCFAIAEAPGAMQIISQTNVSAEFWAQTRLYPVLKACEKMKPFMRTLSRATEKKDQIIFPHMPIILGGANITNAQEKSVQYEILDECWQYDEGLINQFEKRLHDRWNGVLVMLSQGGWTDSEWHKKWKLSDQRRFHWHCTKCKQLKLWDDKYIKYEIIFNGDELNWGEINKTVHWECDCKKKYSNTIQTRRELHDGSEYVVTNPNAVPGYVGFQFSKFACWWVDWVDLVREKILAEIEAETGDADKKNQYHQKTCAEFVDKEIVQNIDPKPIVDRTENYIDAIPNDVLLVTVGIDIQEDRIELYVEGWGKDEQTWALDYKIFPGETDVVFDGKNLSGAWELLDNYLYGGGYDIRRADGAKLRIEAVGIDSGHVPDCVYKYANYRKTKRIYVLKGSSQPNQPIARRSATSKVRKATIYLVGVDTAKKIIYKRLAMKEPGAGYCHFPVSDAFGDRFFKQLTSEKVVLKKTKEGEVRAVFKRTGANEALATKVYAMAAKYMLGNIIWSSFEKRLEKEADLEKAKIVKDKEESVSKEKKHVDNDASKSTIKNVNVPKRLKIKGGFVKGWK